MHKEMIRKIGKYIRATAREVNGTKTVHRQRLVLVKVVNDQDC